MIVIACPVHGADINPEALVLALHHKALHSLMHIVKLLQTWLI